jgi:ferrous iron transport protein A
MTATPTDRQRSTPQGDRETLAALAIGASAEVIAIIDHAGLGVRLMEMGFVPGTSVTLIKRAPFGDPLEVRVRGSHISLRRAEARRIEVRARDEAAAS